jgi:hypothetical protein
MAERFVARCQLPYSAAEVFRWHSRPGALQRLSPPWEAAEILEQTGGVENQGRVVLRVKVGPIWRRWIAQHLEFEPDRAFHDTQVEGPFAAWNHWHRFEPLGPAACQLEDSIDYALPGGAVGRAFGGRFVRRKLARLFRYRHTITGQDLARHHPYQERTPLNVLISGASGLVGGALTPFLTTGGHSVRRLVRGSKAAAGGDIAWDPDQGQIDARALEGLDAVVHLAGENIAGGRWTTARKERIRDSRVKGTRLLSEALAGLQRPPKVLVAASAIGFYGDRGDEILNENSAAGAGFLADVCREWEVAAEPARRAGIRTVHVRFGVILSPKGGALPKMMLPFRLGLGGRIGSGRQYVSWVAIDDVVGAIHHALMCRELSGPVNVVAPRPVTNREYTRALAGVLHRPALFPLPAFVARLMLGEMADELLLGSQRVEPQRLLQTGYRFDYPELTPALNHLLGRSPQTSE